MWKTYDGEKLVFGEKRYQKTLATDGHYALLTPDGKAHHVKRASHIAKIFPEQKTQIRQFVRQNRLSFSKREREKSLTKVVENIKSGELRTESLEFLRPSGSKPAAVANSQFSVLSSQLPIDSLITGIPVLDSDTLMAVGSANTKTYIVPGVKKAKASIADDQELAEIVVVAGRQSTVKSTIMGSEKFKPQLLKNIPSAFGESDIMKVVLTLPGVTTVGEASSGYNVRGGATD
jgi:hypothetical protein